LNICWLAAGNQLPAFDTLYILIILPNSSLEEIKNQQPAANSALSD